MNIHKSCAKLVEEQCIGQVRKKPTRDKILPSFLGKIIPEDRDTKRKSSQIGGVPGELLLASVLLWGYYCIFCQWQVVN